MRLHENRLLLSATDLANHLACRHKTTLDRGHAAGTLARPHRKDPAVERLQQRGLDHERAYVAHLHAQGRRVVELRDLEGARAVDRTRRAMLDGADVIVQAAFEDGVWSGRADVLLKVTGKSELGDWLYEVADTKLARETRATTLLQLCVYADLLTPIQGEPAPRMHVVKPGADFPTDEFRFAEFAAYYRTVRARLERELERPSPTYPEPVEHCDVCAWWPTCRRRREDDDHLSLVAGMTTAHAHELERQGRRTLQALATSPRALDEAPRHGVETTFENLRAQAAIQHRGRVEKKPVHELILPVEDDRGLARLPAPTAGDVYLDFEGDPFVGEGGLEYLTGFVLRDGESAPRFEGLWALTRAAEKAAFERFVDLVLARLETWPDLHVYHYAPYEPAALKRLASRHATRERELDRLLRGERFVDLFAVTRQGVRASVERYSLKPIEDHFGYRREVDLREEASPSLQRVNAALELGVPEEITAEDRAAVEGYNRDDCLSLVKLQAWLEELRQEACPERARPPVKPCEESEAQEESAERVAVLFRALTGDLDPDERPWTAEQEARWLLAHVLEYFHRERRVDWWEYFARRDAADDELLRDRKAIVGLEFVETVSRSKQGIPTDRYRFLEQELGLGEGDDVQDARLEPPEGKRLQHWKVTGVDIDAGTIDLAKTGKTKHHAHVIHGSGVVPHGPLPGSLHDLAEWVADHGLESERPEHRAARDLLLRLPPRRADDSSALKADGEELLAAQIRAARALEGGVLAVQGPPGTGKSYTGARVILQLLRDGRRVGVCATSHKVIRNLLDKVLEASRKDSGPPARATHKISSRAELDPERAPEGLTEVQSNEDALAAATAGEVVGAVSWTWARPDAAGALDHLVVDEVGQLSLAFVLAIARSARNLILLGDPQQLQQPQRGAHPEGADVSALAHLLGEHTTMPEGRGLFLDRTWRLHPGICGYTSDLFYERRLDAHPNTARQALSGPTPFAGSGLWFVPVPHAGNQSRSDEEVEAIASLARTLVAGDVGWTDFDGKTASLTPKDVLIIAPYNLQVNALRHALPDFAVGTVDRFQGQEAAVVVYSLTSSSPEDAPRGMSFLYDLNRLNVATSRGRAACIVVGSPSLLEPECRSPEHMRLANGLAAFVAASARVDSSLSNPSGFA